MVSACDYNIIQDTVPVALNGGFKSSVSTVTPPSGYKANFCYAFLKDPHRT